MERDYFTNLPTEITTDILSRLSIRSYATSMCVCKPWRDLLKSDDFVKSKLKTPPALVRFTSTERKCTIFEIEDEDEADLESHDLHYNHLMDLEIPHGNGKSMDCIAANGLLLLYSPLIEYIPHVCICNPITREYTELCCPEDCIIDKYTVLSFGFGMSKISGQYKVVYINLDIRSDSGHHVYTLGTGTWRYLDAGIASNFNFCRGGGPVLCNGSLHWRVFGTSWKICCFDIETECFSIFSFPYMEIGNLSVLSDCLCYSSIEDGKIVIWMMREYQVEEYWTVVYTLSTTHGGFEFYWYYTFVDPIILFKDDDILMLLDKRWLIYYSNSTRTIQHFEDAVEKGYITSLVFTPNLFSLKNFGFEEVISF